ncbi:MAG: NAD-dependent epimerase/dehydratase family protein [Myxococcales bacterium]|jgi:nucleoside-diphosphate-sugar epimerase
MSSRSTSALVTGASGFFGSHLAAALLARGYRVRALVRRTSDLSRLQGLGVERFYGDVCDPASLRRATEGQRLVFHCAGKVSDWGTYDQFFAANVIGTRNVVAACQDSGVARLVHISSLTVLGLPRTREVLTEESPYASEVSDAYTLTKIKAEGLARAAHGERGLEVVVVRPGVIWGRGDTTILPRFVELMRKRQMVYIDGWHNLVALSHVENLSLGCALAAEVPAAAGRLYHVTDGEDLTAREVLDGLADVFHVPRPRLSLPFSVVYAIAGAMERIALARDSSRPPAITRYGVRLVSNDCRYDISRARRELGYKPIVSFREGIRTLAQ